MGNIIYDAVHSRYGSRTTPSGYHPIPSPCCHHRGHRPDRTKRNGYKLFPDGGFLYRCFNCAFDAAHAPGKALSRKIKELLGWMGFTDEQIRKLSHEAFSVKMRAEGRVPVVIPDGLKTLNDWANEGCEDDRFLKIATFLQSDQPPQDLREYYWTPDPNDIALDGYVVSLGGDLSFANSWWAFPVLDSSLPVQTHNGPDIEQPSDDEIPQDHLDEFERQFAGMTKDEDQ